MKPGDRVIYWRLAKGRLPSKEIPAVIRWMTERRVTIEVEDSLKHGYTHNGKFLSVSRAALRVDLNRAAENG